MENKFTKFFEEVEQIKDLSKYDKIIQRAEDLVNGAEEFPSKCVVQMLEAAAEVENERGVWRTVLVVFKSIREQNVDIFAAYNRVAEKLRASSATGVI